MRPKIGGLQHDRPLRRPERVDPAGGPRPGLYAWRDTSMTDGGRHGPDDVAALRVAPSPTPSDAIPEARGPGGRADRDGAGGGAVRPNACRTVDCERAVRSNWNYCDSHAEELISASHRRGQ